VPFSVRQPETTPTPVVVEVPHAGLFVDPLSLATLAAPAHSIGRDADLYVDDLYVDAPAEGATLLAARYSRYVCDLNRGLLDYDSSAVEGGPARAAPHGLIWRTTTEDRPALVARLKRDELERRLNQIYRPYHATLQQLLRANVERFGYAILLCAHSMPSRGRVGHADPGRERADVVPGSRGRTSAASSIIELAERIALSFGWTVAHDDPYRGGFSTGHYGRPVDGVHAIQIELARRLYMDELGLRKLPEQFERTREFCRTLVRELGGVKLGKSPSR
jgi:N-formylglutamate amidohydrolase